MSASMKQTEAIKSREKLTKELCQIERLRDSSSTMGSSILPKLVSSEIQRLTVEIGAAFLSMGSQPHKSVYDLRVPELEGESMLSHMLAEFELSSAEETAKFKQTLNSELEALRNSTVQFPLTSELTQKVIDYTEELLKKQQLDECAVSGAKDILIVVEEYNAAKKKRDRLRAERNIIRNRARAKAVDTYYLIQLMDAEIERLSDDIVDAILKSMSNEIKIPVEGASVLSRMPVEYDLSSAAETEKFIQKLANELKWVMSLAEKFPLTFQFIQRAIGYAERYKREKRSSEVAVSGRTADNQTLGKIPKRHSF